MSENVLNLGTKREVFWDRYLVDTERTTAFIRQLQPELKGSCFLFDQGDEMNGISYPCVVKDGFGFLIVEMIVGVVVALMLYYLKSKKALNFYQTTIMLPRFLSIVIISYMAYAVLSPTYGVLNQFITWLGGDPVAWYNESKWWPAILTIVDIWMVAGSGSLYYYGALVSIDTTLFEAAEIDGANTLQKCRYVAIPHLVPVMVTLLILGIGRVFAVDMGLFNNVTMDQAILYETTDIISTYTYRTMLTGAMERSAAVSLAQSVVGLIMVLITNGIIRKVDPDNAMF